MVSRPAHHLPDVILHSGCKFFIPRPVLPPRHALHHQNAVLIARLDKVHRLRGMGGSDNIEACFLKLQGVSSLHIGRSCITHIGIFLMAVHAGEKPCILPVNFQPFRHAHRDFADTDLRLLHIRFLSVHQNCRNQPVQIRAVQVPKLRLHHGKLLHKGILSRCRNGILHAALRRRFSIRIY